MSEDYYKELFSKRLNYYMELNNKSQVDLIHDLGITRSTISTWVNGKRLPRMDKIDMLADYFHCTRSDLIGEKAESEDSEYYTNSDTAKLAQEMFEDQDMRSLFHMKKNMDPNAFQTHIDYMKKLYKLEHPDYDEGC